MEDRGRWQVQVHQVNHMGQAGKGSKLTMKGKGEGQRHADGELRVDARGQHADHGGQAGMSRGGQRTTEGRRAGSGALRTEDRGEGRGRSSKLMVGGRRERKSVGRERV